MVGSTRGYLVFVVSVDLGCGRLDGVDYGVGLGCYVALAGEGAEAGCVVGPRLCDEGCEVLCANLAGAEAGTVVAVSLVLGEALGSEAVGDEGVSVGVAEVDAYKHGGSFCGVDGGVWFRLRLGCWG